MTGKELRIVYMGTPDFAEAPLRALVERGYNVVAVVTMPDKAAGRGLKLQQSSVKRYAMEVGLRVFQPEKLKSDEFVEQFRALDVDLGIVVAFRMLPEVIWAAPRLGTFNLHASLLPQYRGAAPINWAIINGDKQTGVTTFLLNHKIDEGAIIERSEVDIDADDSAGTLHDKLMNMGVELVIDTVEKIACGDYEPIVQDNIDVKELRPAPKIFKEDCHIDFSRNGAEIVNLIRGLSPYPAAWAKLDDKLSMKVFSASFSPLSHDKPCGTIVSDDRTFINVACKDGYIDLKELQLSGKKRMSAEDFLRGFRGICDYKL